MLQIERPAEEDHPDFLRDPERLLDQLTADFPGVATVSAGPAKSVQLIEEEDRLSLSSNSPQAMSRRGREVQILSESPSASPGRLPVQTQGKERDAPCRKLFRKLIANPALASPGHTVDDDDPGATICQELPFNLLRLRPWNELIAGKKRLQRVREAALESFDLRPQPGIAGQRLQVEAAAPQEIGDILDADGAVELLPNPDLEVGDNLVGISDHPAPSELTQVPRLFRGVLEELDFSPAQEVVSPDELSFVVGLQLESPTEGLEGLHPLLGGGYLMLEERTGVPGVPGGPSQILQRGCVDCGDEAEAMLRASHKLIAKVLEHAPGCKIAHPPVGAGTVLGFALLALPGAVRERDPEV
ncbi:MAG TPA: hypothetical protein VFR31_12240 [Thermoanaerobaculia bacterium]|nr:hypothetical protein [Thermoanaerobaculia bacterium]